MIHQYQLAFVLLLIFVIGFGMLARKLATPYPIVLVLGGLLLSFIPGLPRFTLSPDLVFLLVLPPLLYGSATQTSWRDFKYNLVSIGLLAFGLVLFTVVGVAFAAHMLIPGLDWRLGLVLGATVAPTDAIAATAIAKRIGLPPRLVDLLEGESLVNDASGLLALQFSTALVVTGSVPSWGGGVASILLLVAGGVGVGLIVAKLVHFGERRFDDAPIEIAISLATPYIAYMAAESIHASGVLATVTAGLYLGRRSSSLMSSGVRVESRAFWNTLTFLLNAMVFLIIGLQLPFILHAIRSLTVAELLLSALQLSVSVVALRLLWAYPGAYVAWLIRVRLLKQSQPAPDARSVFVVGWTGMRGVISLAAVLSLPGTLADGTPFPQRGVLIFLTFSVILFTLVVQGLSLPPLIRALHLAGVDDESPAERTTRRAMLEAALLSIDDLRSKEDGQFDAVYNALAQSYQQRLRVVQREEDEQDDPGWSAEASRRWRSLSQKLRDRERQVVINRRTQGEISAELRRKLERELDLLDVRFAPFEAQ